MMGTEQFHFRERHQKLSQKMPLALSLSHLFTPLQFISFSLSLSPSVSPSFSLSQSLSPSLTSLLPSLLHFTVFASSPKAFFLQIFSMKSEKGKRVGRKETCYENKTFFASLTFFLPEVKKKFEVLKKVYASQGTPFLTLSLFTSNSKSRFEFFLYSRFYLTL